MRQSNIFRYERTGLTLIELLVTVGLLAVISLAVSNMDIFSRRQLIASDRRSRLQNEVSYVLQHMTNIITLAIGNRAVAGSGSDPVRFNNILGNRAIQIFIDNNYDGRGSPVSGGTDRWVAYRFTTTNEVRYYSNCGNGVNPSCSGSGSLIARYIRAPASPVTGTINATGNVVNIQLSATWASGTVTVENPNVTMRTSVEMPAVSIN